MNFDEIIDRRGSNSLKWDKMEATHGVSPADGLAMWIADMDFRAGDFLQDAVTGLLEKANYGYFCGEPEMKQAVAAWMRTRHGWNADPSAMVSAYGLGNGIALCLDTFTDPGDEIIIFTPVYPEFGYKIRNAGRVVKESPLMRSDGLYRMDLEGLEASLTGREKAVLFCSPHNPAGRVWTAEELRALAAFCMAHDLLLMSDEIHHDLIFPGYTHLPFAAAVPEIADRLIMLTSASKTFNIAGSRLGTLHIPNGDLRARFERKLTALNIQPNLLGVVLTQAAYCAHGAEWVDALVAYISENARVFSEGIGTIPGLRFMPMQGTYLSWVDFDGTGMPMSDVLRRVKGDARIAPGPGREFGTGGEMFLRFNIAMPRVRVAEAVSRLQAAFGDLQ